MRLRVFIIVLISSSVVLCAETKRPDCQSFTIAGELLAKAKFERVIGNGLTFRLTPTRLGANGQLDGWEIYIVHAEAPEQDYIFPVNLPLRFNGVQILGASYNDDAKTTLDHPHEMWFLLNKSDYVRIWPAVEHAYWPYMSTHPDKAGDEFFSALKTVETGWLKFTALHYDIASDADSIKKMEFHVNFIVPKTFERAPDLKSQTVPCHAGPQ